MIQSKLIIYTDGGARGNPGPAASGIVIMDASGVVVESFGRYLGHATNNQAEYKAVLFALEAARKYQPQEIEFRLDSELVVRQLIGQYKVKNLELKAIYDQILDAIKPYKTSFSHVYRADNKLADKQVNLAIDANLKNRPI